MRNMMRDAGNVENKEKQYTVVAWICLILALLFQVIARNVPGFADCRECGESVWVVSVFCL